MKSKIRLMFELSSLTFIIADTKLQIQYRYLHNKLLVVLSAVIKNLGCFFRYFVCNLYYVSRKGNGNRNQL